jgi:chloramphenicol 3-O phosphotransferase
VEIQVIVLNGASSSGKSGLARCLQHLLPGPWLSLGVDTLIGAMPVSADPAKAGIAILSDGQVVVGTAFRDLEAAWIAGVAAMARAGARIIVDEVFLSGAAAQQRWIDAIGDLDVLWVGVRCDPEVAASREIARGDRVPGMSLKQAAVVHEGVRYDLEVDTTHAEAIDLARVIAARLLSSDR